MAFAEVRIDEGLIVYGATGGASYLTDIVEVNSGYEYRNSIWSYPKGKWDLGQRDMMPKDMQTIVAFHHARRGRYEGFRFKDWADFSASHTTVTLPYVSTQGAMLGITPTGYATTDAGTGYPTYQLNKNYTSGASTTYRKIQKPVAGTVIPWRGSAAVVAGSAAGNFSVDTTTGIVTFVPDTSEVVSAITTGSSTIFTVPVALPIGLTGLVYLTGFTGTGAALVNGIAHTVTFIGGAGPYNYTISTNTAGAVITVNASSLAQVYPQPTDAMTADFQFDVPVRFDVDKLDREFIAAFITTPTVINDVVYHLPPVPIVEIRP